MNKALLILAIALMCGLMVSSAYASYFVKTWVWTPFNSATWTYYQFADDGKGDKSFTATIINRLLNGSTLQWAKVAFMNSSTSTDRQALILMFQMTANTYGGTLKVYYCDGVLGVADVLIATGTYDENSTKVILQNGLISVYTKTNGYLVKDFGFDEDVNTIGVCGGSNYVSNGYLQVLFNTGTGAIGSTVMEWMPIVVSFAMLGVLLGIVKKYAS
jgi:hypothetical protein